MALNYQQEGDVIDFTAPAGGVLAGTAYLIGQLLVVALVSAAAGATFSGKATGVWELPKLSAQAWTEGALVYWDNSNKRLTTVATGNTLVGVAAAAAANPSATGLARLNGAARPAEA